jgi:signal transduction histidine kinase
MLAKLSLPDWHLWPGAASLAGALRAWWNRLTLARQFLFAGSAVLIAGMGVLGIWVSGQIEAGVIRNSAAATALYVDSVIAPLLPNLRASSALSEGAQRALDETLSQGALGRQLASFKIWLPGGLVAYSSESALSGRRFPVTRVLQEAWSGHVSAEFNDLREEENESERAFGIPLLEVYSPIREPWSGKVVAVAEFYEIASELQTSLADARIKSWLVVAGVTLCMMGLLSGIVLRGSRVITEQRRSLEERVRELSQLLEQNVELRQRVQAASGRSTALNERYLRRIGAELHDGPAQLLALASLRLGSASLVAGLREGACKEVVAVRSILDDAMREIRDISRGLTLPQIEGMTLSALIAAAVSAHERRRGIPVPVSGRAPDRPLSQSEKICVYRFLQEGLNNASRHAPGAPLRIEVACSECVLSVAVIDEGLGFDQKRQSATSLGLAGLRERVDSLGGDFAIESSANGTRLAMKLTLAPREN